MTVREYPTGEDESLRPLAYVGDGGFHVEESVGFCYSSRSKNHSGSSPVSSLMTFDILSTSRTSEGIYEMGHPTAGDCRMGQAPAIAEKFQKKVDMRIVPATVSLSRRMPHAL